MIQNVEVRSTFTSETYTQLRLLGEGKFGKVYLVKDGNNNYFAMKIIEVS